MFRHSGISGVRVTIVAALAAFALTDIRAQRPSTPPKASSVPAIDTVAQALTVGGAEIVRTIVLGEEHIYKFTLRAGELARAVVDQRGVDVIVGVRGPDGAQIMEVDSPNGDLGPEPVEFIATGDGTYRLVVRPVPDATIKAGGTYAVRLTAVLSPAQHAAEIARARARTDTTIDWIASNAVPIQSIAAGSGFADLRTLKSAFREARIVGVGEATHGSHEFFQFKHRLLEFLVREMGFRVFAIEASLSAAENIIDPYVQGGPGEIDTVLASQGFWTWNTEEVRDLLAWMRAYNQSVSPRQRVHFVGIDIQINSEARKSLLGYFRRVAPEHVAQAETLFELKVDSLAWVNVSDTSEMRRVHKQLLDAKRRYDELFAFVSKNETRFATLTSQAEAEKALRYARLLAEHLDAYSAAPSDGMALRDRYMTENVTRLLDILPANSRVMLWAHNAHIEHKSHGSIQNALGYRLRQLYGSSYYAVGFSFGGGAFQAQDCAPGAKLALTEFRVDAPPEGSIDWLLGRAASQIGATTMFVDLRGHTAPPAARDWLAEPHMMFSIGSVFDRGWPMSAYTESTVLTDAFDGVVYFRSTTRARPISSPFFVGRFCQ